MKLCTDILPRRDGTVVAPGAGKHKFTFEDHGDGLLTCDVEDEASLALLIGSGNFYPFHDDDIGRALEVAGAAEGTSTGGGIVGMEGVGADDLDDDPNFDEAGPDDLDDDASGMGLPVEAGTPPVPSRKGKRKAA